MMEVLLATGILLGCTVVLVELSNQGRRHSMAALEQATAQTICSTYVNEILAGLREATTQEAASIEEYPGWTVATSLGTHCMVSKIAMPAVTDPPGELM